MAENDAEQLVALGAVTKPHGVRGQLRVFPYNRDSKLWKRLTQVSLFSPQGERSEHAVKSATLGAKFVIVCLADVSSFESADALRKHEIRVRRESFPELADDEFYYADLPGLKVIDEDDELLGEVVQVLEYPAVDCAEVRALSGGVREVPLQRPWLRDVRSDALVVRDWEDLPERSG